MPHPLDHLLWAAPDLPGGVARFAELSGVTAGRGGEHPGFGTRNALATLGDDVYLEIIAPDPSQRLAGTRGEALVALPAPKLLTFAVRTDDMARVATLVADAGLRSAGPIAMSRRHPQGHLLAWRVLRIEPGPFGDLIPFFIDWGDTPHPAGTTTAGCRLLRFDVAHPDAAALDEVYRALEIAVAPQPGDRPALRATIETPNGEVVLTG